MGIFAPGNDGTSASDYEDRIPPHVLRTQTLVPGSLDLYHKHWCHCYHDQVQKTDLLPRGIQFATTCLGRRKRNRKDPSNLHHQRPQ